MVEGNGGSLSSGERLTRIETRLDAIFERLDNRISEHKKANEASIAQLASNIMNEFGKRVAALEQSDTADHAVKKALEEYQAKQQASFRWAVGLIASLGVGNLIITYIQATG